MNTKLNRDALRHLADALTEDIVNTPGDELLAEVAEDYGNQQALSNEFDVILGHAVRRSWKQRAVAQANGWINRLWSWSSPRSLAFAVGALVLTIGANVVYFEMTNDSFSRKDAVTRGGDQSAPTPAAIRYFVERYGGSCFFVTPVTIDKAVATIEGYAASAEGFDKFSSDFKQAIGFVPSVQGHVVNESQCPAINFLRRVRPPGARELRMEVDRLTVRNGETITGTVDQVGSFIVDLLMVSPEGTVENVSGMLEGTASKTFRIRIQVDDARSPTSPILLIAVTSSDRLNTLSTPRPTAANDFFTQLIAEAAQSQQTIRATTRYISVRR